MRQTIYDFLYNDEYRPSRSYSPEEIQQKSQVIFPHVYRAL